MCVRFGLSLVLVGAILVSCVSTPSVTATSDGRTVGPDIIDPAVLTMTLDSIKATSPNQITHKSQLLRDELWMADGMALTITSSSPIVLSGLKLELSETTRATGNYNVISEEVLAKIKKNGGYEIRYSDLFENNLVQHGRVLRIRYDSEAIDINIRLSRPVEYFTGVKYPILYVFNGSFDSFNLQNFSPSLSLSAVRFPTRFSNFEFLSLDAMFSITPSDISSTNYALTIGAYVDLGGWVQIGALWDKFDSIRTRYVIGFRPDTLVANILLSATGK